MNDLMIVGSSFVGGLIAWLIVYLVVKHEYPKRKAYYSGKQLMSDEEFLTFKKAAVDQDVRLIVTELNSRAPIYVDFHVSLPHTKTFPFGKRTEERKSECFSNNILGMMSVILISAFSICSFVMGIYNLFGFILFK
jgi:hypothetical protein